MSPSLADLRAKLETLDNDEFMALCQDQFPRVYAKLTAGMTRDHQHRLLLDHVDRKKEGTRLLAVLGSGAAPGSPVARPAADEGGTSVVTLTLKMPFRAFQPSHRQLLQTGLAAFLDIPRQDVNILGVREGSTVVTLQIPAGSAARLLAAFRGHDPALRKAVTPLDISLLVVGSEELSPTIGILTALPEEYDAFRAMLSDFDRMHVRGREYGVGHVTSARGGRHAVVVAQTLWMGNTSAGLRAEKLLSDFPAVKSVIMCGIAGGLPDPGSADDDVRLGDIVVSDRRGVIQYDFGKQFTKVFEVRASPRPPSPELLTAVQVLTQDELTGSRPWLDHLAAGLASRGLAAPDQATDVVLDKEGDPVARPTRAGPTPRVFHGPIASANAVQADWRRRDALRKQFRVKAVEMEGSGVADAAWEHGVGYLVVRGVCDYCDDRTKHGQTDVWKRYAALAAAAYARALLEAMPGESPGLPS